MTTEDLLNYYYTSDKIVFEGRKAFLVFNPETRMGVKPGADGGNPKTNRGMVRERPNLTRMLIRQMEQARINQVPMSVDDVIGRVAAHDIKDPATGKVVVECNHEITQEKLDLIREKGIEE